MVMPAGNAAHIEAQVASGLGISASQERRNLLVLLSGGDPTLVALPARRARHRRRRRWPGGPAQPGGQPLPGPSHLANRLVGILHGCLSHHTLYDENQAWHTPDDKLTIAA